MSDETLRRTLKTVFTHAGYVRYIDLEWPKEGLCIIKTKFLPWSETSITDVTSDLIDAGTIIDDSCLYLQIPNKDKEVTATITLDMKDDDWRKSLAKQMGYILAQELRAAVCRDE